MCYFFFQTHITYLNPSNNVFVLNIGIIQIKTNVRFVEIKFMVVCGVKGITILTLQNEENDKVFNKKLEDGGGTVYLRTSEQKLYIFMDKITPDKLSYELKTDFVYIGVADNFERMMERHYSDNIKATIKLLQKSLELVSNLLSLIEKRK